jgi:hypothetical protein
MTTELTNSVGEVYLTLEYDSENHWIYTNWIGYQTQANATEGSEVYLQLMRRYACPYLLNDNRNLTGSWNHTVAWVATEWAVRARNQGVTHFAHIISPDAMGAGTAKMLHSGLSGYLTMRLFNNMLEAQAWLREAQQEARNSAPRPEH